MALGFPKINLLFQAAAQAAIARGNGGVAALMLADVTAQAGTYELRSFNEVPAGFSDVNKGYIQQAFMGGPTKVIAVVKDSAVSGWSGAMTALENYKFNYVACPGGESADMTAISTWVKSMRASHGRHYKFVGGNIAGDSEGVINFATEGVIVGETTYTAIQFTARIAGLLAGTPNSSSVTFAVLSEVDDITTRISEEAAGTAIGLGKLVLFHDGEQVKIARGVNSLVTLAADKTEAFKKIKIVDILDAIAEDIKKTAEGNFIGRVPNSYENKLLLINAINGYFRELEASDILDVNQNKAELDLDAIRGYLGAAAEGMKDADVKAANTGDKVFLKADIKPLDSMEEISITLSL